MTTVSGIVRDTEQNAIAGASVSVVYRKPLVGFNGGAAVQNVRQFTTAGDGTLAMADLVPGHYDIDIAIVANDNTTLTVLRRGTMTVLDQATQTLQNALDASFQSITPSDVQRAEAAAAAAELAAETVGTLDEIIPIAQEISENRDGAVAAKDQAEDARDLAETYAGVVSRAASVAGLTDPTTLTIGDLGYVSGSGDDAVDGVYEVQDDTGNVWFRIGDTGLVGKASVESVQQPIWAGLKSAWVDPFFKQVVPGQDFAGRSRWYEVGGVSAAERYQIVPSVTFPGCNALRETSATPGENSGPRLWLDEIDAEPGDTVTIRALLAGAGASGGVAAFFYTSADATAGSQINLTTAASATTVVTSGTAQLLSWTGVVPANAVGARILPYVSGGGAGPVDVQALWACKGDAASVPVWPSFGGDPAAHAAAEASVAGLAGHNTRLQSLEGGQSYVLDSSGAVLPSVEAADVELAVTSVLPDSTYGATFRGWAERYTPAGVSFNAIRIRSIGRKADVAAANFWRTIKVVVRAAETADAHLGASSTLVATGEALVNPASAVLEDIVVILRDRDTGEVVTLTDDDLGAEYLIGTYFLNAEGGVAYGSPHRGTMSNALGSPQSYWVTTQNPETGDWQVFTANWRLGVDHLLLTDPVDTVVYSPSAGFLSDVSGSAAVVPDIFNASALRQYAKRITAGEAVTIAMLGDSWTNGGYRMHTPLYNLIDAAYGISAPGWISANLFAVLPVGGVRSRPGTWTEARATPDAIGPDNCHASTTDTDAYITFGSTGTVAKFFLHYLQQPGGGSFSWSVSGGPVTVVNTNGTLSYEVVEINGPGLLRVDIDTAGSEGVLIAGCDVRNATVGEFVLHKLGASGGRADHFAEMGAGYLEAGYTAIAPDVVMICLGTNDKAGSVGLNAFRTSIETIIDRISTAATLSDFVLVGPGPNDAAGSLEIDDYNAVLYAIAAERDLAFVNLKSSLGSYADADARGLYEDTVHPNTAGGLVIGRALWRALYKE